MSVKRTTLAAVDDDDPLMRAFASPSSPPLSPSQLSSATASPSTSSPLFGTTPPAAASAVTLNPAATYTPPVSTAAAAPTATAAAAAAPTHRATASSGTGGMMKSLASSFTSFGRNKTLPNALTSTFSTTSSSAAASPPTTTSSLFSSATTDNPLDPDAAERRRREREGTVRPSAISTAPSVSANGFHPPPLPALSETAPPFDDVPAGPLILPYQDYTLVDDELMLDYVDDWESHGDVPGEKLVMKIECVFYYRDADSVLTNTPQQSQQVLASKSRFDPLSSPAASQPTTTSVGIYTAPATLTSNNDASTVIGTLVMTSYQIYLEPLLKDDRTQHHVIDGLIAMPLSTIEKIVMEPPRGQLHIVDLHGKDGRVVRFGFGSSNFAKRAFDTLNVYVFPNDDTLLFAFYYKLKHTVPPHLNGWNLYNPVAEFKRLGIPNRALRICSANKDYHLSTSYPALFVVPAEQYFTDADLEAVAKFRSRGRVPACTWQHPTGRQTIWRCSQPRVGMNNQRCAEDEKLVYAISQATGIKDIAIFDCRPRLNAQANRVAGKGFESELNYRNSKIYFMNIENIHAMRKSFRALVKACQQDIHTHEFGAAVAASQWLLHIGVVLKAVFQMVLAIDRDKSSIVSHCSDGWDRTSQLVSLTEICLDPYYRTIEGFCVLVEKDWISFGHQFAKRTGHRENKVDDTQRSPIMLQWCDCVFQLTQQFPRHFEFNSFFLVTLMSHLYSCRFGTFFCNTEVMRKKLRLGEKTVSLWTYMMCSPAACRGEFTNPLYAPNGLGTGDAINEFGVWKEAAHVYDVLNKPHIPQAVLTTEDGASAGGLQKIDEKAAAVDAGAEGEAAKEAGANSALVNGAASDDKQPENVAAPSDASAPAGVVTAASSEAEEKKPTADTAASASGTQVQPTEETKEGEKQPSTVATEEKESELPADGDPLLKSSSFTKSVSAASNTANPATLATTTSTPSINTSRTNRSSSVSDEPPSPRKTSIGRGGGDGSHKDYAGSVLYPSFSYKKITLWTDWFLRFHSDQAEHSSAFGPLGPGSVPPGGATTTQWLGNDGLWARVVRQMSEEKGKEEAELHEKEEAVRRLEAEVTELKARLDKAGLSTDVSTVSVEKREQVKRKEKPPRPVRVYDISRAENSLMEDLPDLSNVQEENDPEDQAADV